MSEDEQRKLKYLDVIRELERELDQRREAETALRKLAERLGRCAQGRSPVLDQALGEIISSLGTQLEPARVEALTARLQTALRDVDLPDAPPSSSLDDAPDPSRAATAAPTAFLEALQDRLPAVPGLRGELESLIERLERDQAPADWGLMLNGVANVLKEQCLRAQRERHELESFLKEITDRLGEFDAYLTGQNNDMDASRQEGVSLETRIQGEVRELQTGMARVGSLDELRTMVSLRLDAIGDHVRSFREADERRCEDYRTRAERMRARIVQLEHEAQGLRRTMDDERKQALIDQLTGVPNRQAFDERLAQEYSRWKRFNTPLALIMWDVDRFKLINDSYGHKAGDKVIRAVAQKLKERIRETDMVARYGGEEFVMLLTGASGQDALAIAEKIRAEIAGLGFHFRGERVPITISAGIALFAEGDTPETAFDNADRALYEAKNTGRNRCVLH
ncbi:GGDEF domain-containing protein [Thioalkalivibrio sulfidiphilus]|uniref:diguanylate cyclase n=1 Tax=Thioalkalivibrio sulfidiphilus (strain HL-EbGR7) TaxID=396588 RepID=B8GTD8_THISH|nr:GGDEF domain-containing protein [Thioalkalivibrio sulfidiphilus]ACL71198.1 diguanylate cyclase [Thioalkalivibrio sulfidiphilus HL-EbGr7]